MWRLFTLTLWLLVTAWTRESCFLPLAHKQLTALGFILSLWLLLKKKFTTLCIPGFRWHQTLSQAIPQSLYIFLKIWNVTWTGSGLDAVHGERGRTERMVGRESAGLRETVWLLHYCNHKEIKTAELHPLRSAGKLVLCTKRLRSYPP